MDRFYPYPSWQNARNLFHSLFHLLTTQAAVACFWLAALATALGGVPWATQTVVSWTAQAAWLGTAPKGYIRIYECENHTSIDRNQVIGQQHLCPGSEVKAISIEESATYTTDNVYQLLTTYYLLGVMLAAACRLLFPFAVGVSSAAPSKRLYKYRAPIKPGDPAHYVLYVDYVKPQSWASTLGYWIRQSLGSKIVLTQPQLSGAHWEYHNHQWTVTFANGKTLTGLASIEPFTSAMNHTNP